MNQHAERLTITEQVATDLLNKSEAAASANGLEKVNRRLRSKKVAKYARMMAAGLWDDRTHQGIAVSPEGYLVDGQHRLWAVIESKTTQVMWVTFNVALEAQKVMDDGSRRSATDFSQFNGLQLGVARFLVRSRELSNAEANAVADRYADAIEFTTTGISKHVRGVTLSPVLAVVARAYYSQDRVRLQEFIKVLHTGYMVGPQDGAAVKLRNWLMGGQTRVRTGSELRAQQETKTTYCLIKFLARRDIARIADADPSYFKVGE